MNDVAASGKPPLQSRAQLGPPPLRVIPRLMLLGLLCLPPFNRLYAKRAARKIRRASRIIAVCKGNTCRSPFLENYLRQRAEQENVALPPIVSRGLLPQNGDASSAIAIETARRFNVDLSGHLSCSIQTERPGPNDVLLVVMPPHLGDLARLFPGAKHQIVYVGLLDKEEPSPFVFDPYNGTADDYYRTYARLQRAVDRLLAELKHQL